MLRFWAVVSVFSGSSVDVVLALDVVSLIEVDILSVLVVRYPDVEVEVELDVNVERFVAGGVVD